MRFGFGSLNPTKLSALRMAIDRHETLVGSIIVPMDVPSGVPKQPLDLETTLSGAIARAFGSFYMTPNDVGVGIESGLIPWPFSDSGWADITTCVLYDGSRRYIGGSSVFEVPADIMKFILEQGADLSEASKLAGYTDKDNVGSQEGIIGVLTKGRITRRDYTIQAVEMALMHFIRSLPKPA